MPKRKRSQSDKSEKEIKIKRRQAPGKTIQTRENQIISMSVDLAARQIKKGTVSSQVLTHFLKLGSTMAQLEKARLEKENLLLQAKTEALQSQKKVEELYANAMKAFKRYNGEELEGEEEDED